MPGVSVHCSGPAAIWCGDGGVTAQGPLEFLGTTEDGADLEISYYDAPIRGDVAGGMTGMRRDASIWRMRPYISEEDAW